MFTEQPTPESAPCPESLSLSPASAFPDSSSSARRWLRASKCLVTVPGWLRLCVGGGASWERTGRGGEAPCMALS